MEQTSSQKGDISELKVHIAGHKRGYSVFFSLGSSTQYDVIFDIKGTLLRLQVKTAQAINTLSGEKIRAKAVKTRGNAKVQYSPTDFDFLIAVHQNDFWVMPMYEIQRRASFFLNAKRERFKNAWHLLEQEADRRARAAYIGSGDLEAQTDEP